MMQDVVFDNPTYRRPGYYFDVTMLYQTDICNKLELSFGPKYDI